MQTVVAIAIFGAAGCLARYFISFRVHDNFGRAFPSGTLCVNIVGAFLIGLTTFSTFSYETFRLLEDGKFIIAAANVRASVVICLAFISFGLMSVRALQQD